MPLAERMPGKNQENAAVKGDLEQIQDWLNTCESADSETEYRTVASEDYKFYAGRQDDMDVLTKLAAIKRPATVYNEVKPKIDMLVGIAAQTPFSPQIIPVGPEDEPLAELMGGTIMHYRRKLKIAEKEMSCFEHTVKSGRSLLYFYIDRSNPFKPQIKTARIPGTNFWIDPDSTEYDLSDARFLFIDKWLTEGEILSFWPNYPINDIRTLSQQAGGEMPSYFNATMERYRLVECWYRKWVRVKWFQNPLTGQVESLAPDEFSDFMKALAQGIPNPQKPDELIYPEVREVYESRIQKVHYSIFSGLQEFEKGMSPYNMEMLPAVLYGGYKDEEYNKWFGAITMMKDPQRGVNTMRRQLSHLLQTLPKGILIHEVGSILNIEEYEEKSSEPTYHMEVGTGKIDKVRFETQPTISSIYAQFDQVAVQSMKDASGIPTEMMGIQTTSREPGITVRTRLEAGSVVLYVLYNNFRLSRIQGTKILMNLIQQYVREPEIIRIQGEQGAKLMQINSQMNPQSQGFNDISAGEFDLEVDEIMESSSMRAATAMMLNDFAHNNPGSIPPDVILEYVNIPFTVKQRIREAWMAQQKAEQENLDADRAVELAKAVGSLKQTEITAAAKPKEKPVKKEKKGD